MKKKNNLWQSEKKKHEEKKIIRRDICAFGFYKQKKKVNYASQIEEKKAFKKQKVKQRQQIYKRVRGWVGGYALLPATGKAITNSKSTIELIGWQWSLFGHNNCESIIWNEITNVCDFKCEFFYVFHLLHVNVIH